MKRLLLALLLCALPAPALAADGWASTWSGDSAATPDCVYPWTDCAPRRVTSLVTGVSIIVTPHMFCLCHVDGVAHPDRLIDLTAGQVAALGLDASDGLFPVSVELVDGSGFPVSLPDTATR